MKLSVITCTTPERAAAFDLCRKYMERQTRQADQWIVKCDPKTSMPVKVLCALAEVTGDAIAFVEDDDWYGPGWLAWVAHQIENHFDIVGEGQAIYYNVKRRWWSECNNVRHASLCQTAISVWLVPQLINTIRSFDNPFFDCRLWRLECNKLLRLPGEGQRHVIGIKGMFENGYSPEHRQQHPKDGNADPSLMKLWKLIGSDAKHYAPFYLK